MDTELDVPMKTTGQTWVGLTTHKPHSFKRCRIGALPPLGGIPSAIQASLQAANVAPAIACFLGEFDVDQSLDECVEVGP